MTWDEYYDGFYDWAESTRTSRISSITEFDPDCSEEVAEVVQELEEVPANRLVRRALKYGVRFTPEQALEMMLCLTGDVYDQVVSTAHGQWTQELYDELWPNLSEDSPIHGRFVEAEAEEAAALAVQTKTRKKKHTNGGLLGLLLLILGGKLPHDRGRSKKKTEKSTSSNSFDHGKCDGNCAGCPPHYGYRYGRWYYGKHHAWGCERGGSPEIHRH